MKKVTILFLSLCFIAVDAYAATSPLCPGQEGYYFTNHRLRNPQQGGFVANTAYADEDSGLFIAKTAAVCDYAVVRGDVKILGRSVVSGAAEVSGRSELRGEIHVVGDTSISGKSIIMGKGQLKARTYKDEIVRFKGKFVKEAFSDLKKVMMSSFSNIHAGDSFGVDHYVKSNIFIQKGNYCQVVIEKDRAPRSCEENTSSYSKSYKYFFNMSDLDRIKLDSSGIHGKISSTASRSELNARRQHRTYSCHYNYSWDEDWEFNSYGLDRDDLFFLEASKENESDNQNLLKKLEELRVLCVDRVSELYSL